MTAFADLPAGLRAIARRRSIAEGEAVFRQGDAARGIYVLVEGSVHLLRHVPDGGVVLLHAVRPGETFAEAALHAGHYHCDAVARAESVVVLLPRADLTALLRRDAEVMEFLFRRFSAQVRDLRSRLELRNIRGAEERLLTALRLRQRDDGVVVLSGTLKDLAAELGLAHETLYRTLARLQSRGLVHRRGSCLIVNAVQRPST